MKVSTWTEDVVNNYLNNTSHSSIQSPLSEENNSFGLNIEDNIGLGLLQDDDNFSAGLRGCSLHSNVTAFTTCTETAPHDLSSQKRQVRLAGDNDL